MRRVSEAFLATARERITRLRAAAEEEAYAEAPDHELRDRFSPMICGKNGYSCAARFPGACTRYHEPPWSGRCPRRARIWQARLEVAGIPVKCRRATPDLARRPDQPEAEWARALAWPDGGRQHLVITGNPGSGKSWLASRLLQAFLWAGRTGEWIEVAGFDPVRQEEKLARCERAYCVVLNDLGTEWQRGGAASGDATYTANRLEAIIRAVDESEGRVIVTTNLTSDERRVRYSEAVNDRLDRLGERVVLTGPSLRGR